jgi:pyruvate oxidase
MGAWAANTSRPVVAVTGDGGFGPYLAEVTTAVKYGIPIKHVLLDNRSRRKISKEQHADPELV